MSTEQILTLLAEGPPRIAAIIDGLTEVQLHTASEPDEWSANDVLAHLRACADMWGGKILRMIDEDHPTIRTINPRAWIKQTNYLDQEFGHNLHAYMAQRAELLAVLEPLPPEGWTRGATVTGAGRPLAYVLHFEAEAIARHERPHIKQIERIVNRVRM